MLFEKELAVMVVRVKNGETRAYFVVEIVYENNICDMMMMLVLILNKVVEVV